MIKPFTSSEAARKPQGIQRTQEKSNPMSAASHIGALSLQEELSQRFTSQSKSATTRGLPQGSPAHNASLCASTIFKVMQQANLRK